MHEIRRVRTRAFRRSCRIPFGEEGAGGMPEATQFFLESVWIQYRFRHPESRSRFELGDQKTTTTESLILAQNERWRRGLGMQVERESWTSVRP